MRNFKRTSSCSRETKKIRKLLNDEVKFGIHPSSDSETENVDLHKDLQPLGHYMNNREEMIEQMFSIIKGDKLMKMIPPILKDVPLDELKADCLIHLLGMSRKRIRAILEGKDINSSSDSESQSDSSLPYKKTKPIVKPFLIKQEGCSDISDNSEEVILIDPDLEFVKKSTSSKKTTDGKGKSKKRHKKNLPHKNKKISDKKTIPEVIQELQSEEEKNENTQQSSPDSTNSIKDKIPTEGKTLLEILELEMRARAIRALLHKNNITEVEGIVKSPESKSSVEVEKSLGNEVKPVRNFRKKKRKSDDVIVITPKVVTIDLTDENYPSSVNKKGKEDTADKFENITSSIVDDALREVETSNNSATVDLNIECLNLTEVEQGSLTIIGKEKVQENSIEPVPLESNCSEQTQFEDLQKENHQKTNWAQRWLESKEVKKVVSTSKICGSIRKRIKNAKLAKQSQDSSKECQSNEGEHKEEVSSQVIEGSVGEYQSLPKSSSFADSDLCDTESSLVQRNSDDKIGSKDIHISGEQVQDVTSTKSESPKHIISCQENILCGSRENISIGDSNGNICNDESSFHSTKSDGCNPFQPDCNIDKEDTNPPTLKNVDLNSGLNGSTILNESESHTTGKSPQTYEYRDEENQSVSSRKLCSEEKVDQSELSLHAATILMSGNEEKNQVLEQHQDAKIECLDKDITTTSHLNEEVNQVNTENALAIEFCESKSTTCESPSQLIEPETLEINITDEDIDIE